jgi:multiple sugar transport system ATP-binding protein
MGRALVREPSVSLFDEPLSNLDAKLRSAVRAEIKDLQRRTNMTMIYVTHDQVEAMTLGDHVTVMNKGRVQQVAPPRELYDKPVNAFVAGFIGNPPMNLLPATIVGESSGKPAVEIAGQRIALVDDGLAAALRPHAGAALQIGIRPEHVKILMTSDSGTANLRGTVLRTESLGHEMLVYVTLPNLAADAPTLIARVDGMPDLKPGDAVTAALDLARVHPFASGGSRITAA